MHQRGRMQAHPLAPTRRGQGTQGACRLAFSTASSVTSCELCQAGAGAHGLMGSIVFPSIASWRRALHTSEISPHGLSITKSLGTRCSPTLPPVKPASLTQPAYWSQALPAGETLINTGSPHHHATPLPFCSGESQRLNITAEFENSKEKLLSYSVQTATGRIVAQPDLIRDCSDLLGLQNWVGILRRTGSHNNCGLFSLLIGLKFSKNNSHGTSTSLVWN